LVEQVRRTGQRSLSSPRRRAPCFQRRTSTPAAPGAHRGQGANTDLASGAAQRRGRAPPPAKARRRGGCMSVPESRRCYTHYGRRGFQTAGGVDGAEGVPPLPSHRRSVGHEPRIESPGSRSIRKRWGSPSHLLNNQTAWPHLQGAASARVTPRKVGVESRPDKRGPARVGAGRVGGGVTGGRRWWGGGGGGGGGSDQ
jgi:hypothetical protein